jgi:thioredoxin-dependent peroxiredoxin
MMRSIVATCGALALVPMVLAAQTQPPIPAVGDTAPDFSLPVSTAHGVGKTPARLRDFRGQTVILAFFFKVRTSG